MKIPTISGRDAVKAFSKAGWKPVRQKGSHLVMEKHGESLVLVIPQHTELKKGTLRGLIKDARMRVTEFVNLLK